MHANISRQDFEELIEFLKTEPFLTQSKKVVEFETEWSRWLGVRHSLFLNSGSSANFLTMAALRAMRGPGEVIVPALTWVSDIASVLLHGMEPVFVDVDPRTLAMNEEQVLRRLGPKTRAVFLTHVLGFNGLTEKLLTNLEAQRIPLIEDACESHGATFRGRKVGSFGFASNFSCYYGHHLTTIEGGFVCTNDEEFYETCRMMRSHGMVRECRNEAVKARFAQENPDLHPDFIFAFPGYNMRGTEIGGVLGLSQLKRLDENNRRRQENFRRFLSRLDSRLYRTDFELEGGSNYAFIVILKEPDSDRRDRLMVRLRDAGVEFRRGTSGGGNQLRQPYLKELASRLDLKDFPVVEHVHFFGFYIGNYPDLPLERIDQLCDLLNSVG